MAKRTESKKAPGVRARVRAELTAAIKASARRQLAIEGAASLSLRAIARELDMASSAIYRYFPSRDELLTALIIDAYDSIGSAVEDAAAALATQSAGDRFVAIAQAIRAWALANPHEYALIYGSPVPGYAAPDDTIDPATRVPRALISLLVETYGESSDGRGETSTGATARARPGSLAASVAELSDFVDNEVPPEALAGGVRAWGEIVGLVSLELFGHFNNAVTDPEALFRHAMVDIAERTLPAPANTIGS